ncbi:MAG TPA: hypothetical protein VK990_04015 [Acidimicrobiia bacterium]|nr:hypothetical protein [Acidimicrobiia bacterium]
MRTATLLVLLIVATAACGAGSEPSASTLVTTTTSEGETTTMPPSDAELPIVEPAVTDLAERLGVDRAEIEVVMAERVTWPDGSLGCPQPGMSYTQALVEGSRVALGHDGRVYLYHAGTDDQPSLCPSEDKDGGHDFLPPPGFND